MDDPEVRVIVVTGAAGTGKSTAIGAYALDRVMKKGEDSFAKMILSKPLDIVTKTRYWGTVPGDENDKFGPFLKSFSIMFENMIGKSGAQYIKTAIEKKIIEFMPLELMRGATLRDAIVWYDEAQNLNAHEAATLGTRIDDVGNSKLVLSGDLNQRDRQNLKRSMTGLHKLCTSPYFLRSPLTAHVDLKVIERGEIAELFHNVFEKDIEDRD
jgi:predicted ribonuclease YlaK